MADIAAMTAHPDHNAGAIVMILHSSDIVFACYVVYLVTVG
jgi:hypothetical protein